MAKEAAVNERESQDTMFRPMEIVEDGKDPAISRAETVRISALTFGLCLVAFAAALDNTILATAIPRISSDFSSLDSAGWYRNASLVASTALQLPFGKIYALFNVKWTYIASVAIFEIGSIICAMALDSNTFIVGRIVSGVGAAALYSGAISILGLSTPAKIRPALFGTVTSMFGVASLIGPPLGGAFTDSPRTTWRWCFWINLPIGVVAGTMVFVSLRAPRGHSTANYTEDAGPSPSLTVSAKSDLSFRQKLLKLDPLGTFIFIPAVVSLLLALQWGGITYAWGDERVWGCLLCFGILIIAFVVVQLKAGDDAMIPPRLIGSRSVLAGVLFITALSAAMFTHIFFLPFYFQVVLGLSATESGLRTLAYVGAMALSGIFAGGAMSSAQNSWVSRHKQYAWSGAALFTIGAGLLHTLGPDSGTAKAVGYQLLAGTALGIAWQVPFVAIQRDKTLAAIPSGVHAIANALIAFSNSFGASLGIAIAQNIFAGRLAWSLHHIPTLTPQQAQMIYHAGLAAGFETSDFIDRKTKTLILELFNDAISVTLTLPIVTSILAFGFGLIFP